MHWHISLWHIVILAVIAVLLFKIGGVFPPRNGGGDGGRYA